MECEVPKYTLKATKEVRESFDTLGDPSKYKESAITIFKYVSSINLPVVPQQVEEESDDNSSKNSEEVVSTDELSEDILYILKRLSRGILSARAHCHEGYYVVITNLLKSLTQLGPPLHSIFKQCVGKNLKYEKGSCENGRLGSILFYGAMARSGIWKKYPKIFKAIMTNLNMLIIDSGSYEHIIGQFCVDLLSMSVEEDKVPESLYRLFKDSLNQTVDKLSAGNLWIKVVLCRDEYYKHLDNVPSNFQEEIFSEENFSFIFSKLNDLYKSGFDVSPILNDYFISMESHLGKEKGSKRIVSFFKSTILPKLPLPTGTHKLRAFVYLTIAAITPHLNESDEVHAIFCPSFMTEFLIRNNHKVAEVSTSFQKLIKSLSEKVIAHKNIDDGELQMIIIESVINPPMSVLFDTISRSKFIQNSLENLNPKVIQSFTQILFDILKKNNYETEKSVNGIGAFSGDFTATVFVISRCLSQSSMMNPSFLEWRTEQITNLLINIFFRNHPKKEAALLRDIFRKCFEYSSNKLADHINYTDSIIEKTSKHIKSQNHCLKSDTLKCWNAVFKSRSEIKKKSKIVKCINGQIFRLLYNEMCLSALFDVTKTRDLIVDLDDCYQGMSANGLEIDDEQYGDFSEIIDLLLALLSKADHHWRRTIVMLFRNLCVNIEPSNMSLITDVIDPSKQGEFMFDDELEMDVDAEDEADSGVEEDEEEDDEDDDEDESDGLSDDEEENISAKDEKEIKLLNLKAKMQILAGVPGDDDIDIDSAPQSELDSLDKNIGALMKSYLQLKKKSKRRKVKLAKDEIDLMHFRIRVCDLLEALIKVAPSVEHLAELINPLLRAIKNFSQNKLQQQLYKRLRSVFVDLSQVKKFVKEDSDAAKCITENISSLFKTNKNQNGISQEVGFCCTFLVRSGLALCEDSKLQRKLIINAYSKELVLLFTKESSLLPTNFAGPLALESPSLVYVMEALTNYVFDKAAKPFGQIQAASLLIVLLRNEKGISKMNFKKVKTHLRVICSSIIEVLDSLDDEKKVKATLLISYFDIIKAVKGLCRHVEEVERIFDWEGLKTSISNLNDRIDISKPKSLRNSVRAISEVLKVQIKFKGSQQSTKKKQKLQDLEIMDADDEVEESGEEDNETTKAIKDMKKRKAEKQLQKIEKKMQKKNKKQEKLNPEQTDQTKEKSKKIKKREKQERKKQKLWAKQDLLSGIRSIDSISFVESVEV